MKNEKILEFTDISSEQYREYEWIGGYTVRINYPLKLNVSASGGHRILDTRMVSHYIPSGWVHLYWVTKKGEDCFVK